MDAQRLLATAIIPAHAELAAYGIKDSREARRFSLAIALQESGLRHRRQVVRGGAEEGPASSFWQFERGGGCAGVLSFPKLGSIMQSVCAAYNVQPTAQGLWEAMRYQDIVAAAAARVLIYTLPTSLPRTQDEGWAQYLRAWRPGKPRHDEWAANWIAADAAVGAM